MEILSFFTGILFFYTQSIYAFLGVSIALFLGGKRIILIWFFGAIFWAYGHDWFIADQGMPFAEVIPYAKLEGVIESLPLVNQTKTQFQFHLTALNEKPVDAIILLACYTQCPDFKVGQTWQLTGKLKIPKNLGNPGHFDYVRMLKVQHIHWTGYIQPKSANLLAETNQFSLLVWREKIASQLQSYVINQDTLGIIQALTIGITNHIDKSLWELFRRTGTTHLMVISGSHIVLIASLVYWIVMRLWLLSTSLCLKIPAIQVASLMSLIFATAYTFLAGFAVPAQRSLIACLLMLLPNFISRRFTGWQTWRYAFFLVILYEPHAVLQSGFYLSFLAVAILMATNLRITYNGLKKVLLLQLGCLIGLMPFTLFWFSYGAINGYLANLIAIPVVGYILVPGSLIAIFSSYFLSVKWLIIFLNFTVNYLLIFLNLIDKFEVINLNFSLNNCLILFSLILSGIVFFIFPIRRLFVVIFILVISAIFPYFPRVNQGEARIDVLDVGQGLAIVITTASHTLIYDTGMKFYQGSDMAKLAIIPYLSSLGIKDIDKVVISHPDLDHRGGLLSLEEKYPINELIVDNPTYYHRGVSCHTYPEWTWEGVSFRFLPIKQQFPGKNNSSCVLKISSKMKKIMLVGDIEKLGEEYLIKHYTNDLEADALVVAHHGSKTSSTSKFIEQVSPQFAMISAGFDNRYHFPHQQTITRLETHKIKVFNTINCGMITYLLNAKEKITPPNCFNFIN